MWHKFNNSVFFCVLIIKLWYLGASVEKCKKRGVVDILKQAQLKSKESYKNFRQKLGLPLET